MDAVHAIGDTPTKFNTKTGCVFCGCEESDSRKKTKLNGKISDLRDRICDILDIPLSSINVEGYVCNDHCYRAVKRFEKLREDTNTLHRSLKEKFALNTRKKRGVPSDSTLSPSVTAPSKSLRQSAGNGKAAKRLSFREILSKPNPEEVIPDRLPMVWPLLPVQYVTVADGQCEGNICKVEVFVTYESGRKGRELPKDLHRLGKALARGCNFKAIADAAMDCPGLKKAIEDRICLDVTNECKKLCSRKNPSLLRTATKDNILNFSWSAVGHELNDKAPLLHRLLLASADPKSLSQRSDPERYPGVCTAAAILLKNRDKGMSLVPYVISTILKVGRTSKRALVRLNKLGITMSPQSINTALDILGVDYDLPLQNWKDDTTKHLEKCCQMTQEIRELEVRREELGQMFAAREVADQVMAVDESLIRLKDERKDLDEKKPSSFNIVLDNIDLKVHASDMTSENQNKDFHWCNHNAYLDRVNPTHLGDDAPAADLQQVPNSTFLPSLTDQNSLLSDLTVLIGRVLVENLPAFEIFKDVIPQHIKHKYSDVLKKKTETVNLGVIFKDENLGEGMIDIVRQLHGLVPVVNDDVDGNEVFDRIPVVGDQKTMERGVEAQFSVRNAYTKTRRLEGLFFQLADWHHENKFLSLIFARYYSGSSATDKTSLFALRNLVNWRDVVSDAQHNPAPCKRFVSLVLDADIIAAALMFFGMETTDDQPTKHSFSPELAIGLRVLRQRYLHRVVKEFIKTYVVDGTLYENHFCNIQALQEWETAKTNQPLLPNGRYPCRFPGCGSSFKHDGVFRMRHELSHDPPPTIPDEPVLINTVPDPTDQNPKPKHDVFDYHCGFMNMALLLRNFMDAIKEGDGERIIRCIKMFVLHFKQDGSGSIKYALESLYQLFQLFALLSPREAERMKWNRTVNNHGCPGCNVAMDLALEHDNHLLKDMIRGLGANVSEASVHRICMAFFIIKAFLENLDLEMKVKKISGEHSKKSTKQDLKKVVQTLREQNVFDKQPTQEPMSSFPNCPRDYLQLLDPKGLFSWINEHKRNVSLGKRPR